MPIANDGLGYELGGNYVIDEVIKTIIDNRIAKLRPPTFCKVTSIEPLKIKPITDKGDAPEIENAKKLVKPEYAGVDEDGVEETTNSPIHLKVDDIVIVAFPNWDLSSAVILGTVK